MQNPATKNKPGIWKLRPIHRIIGSIVFVFTLYFATTGTLIQLVDLRAILSHAPASNPEILQIREGTNGPGNYVVIQAPDYTAAPLPDTFDFKSALATILHAAHRSAGQGTALNFVDLRNLDGKPIGIVRAGEKTLRFDATTGQQLAASGGAAIADQGQETSLHFPLKSWHRLRGIGNWFALFNAIIAIGLFIMVVTGLVLYFQLLRVRRRAGLNALFWSAGGLWRSLHRGISIVSAIFILVVSATGTMLSLDAFGVGIYQLAHRNAGRYVRYPAGAIDDFYSPLADDKLDAMLQRTLAAGRGTPGTTPIKAIRLRYFNGIPQGILIAGNGDNTAQLVFNADTGKPMSLTEPGYPKTHYHLGWNEHEVVKKIHRGDFFGLPGRFMDLFAGLSLIYLSVSGGVMYLDLWRRRRRGGRAALFWT